MKLFNKKKVGVSKTYALKAALYRRLAKKMGGSQTFTQGDLIELYKFESTGIADRSFAQMKQCNGYAYGKWLRDIDCSSIVEAIDSGEFCKAEFLQTAIERIHNTSFVGTIVVTTPWFPFARDSHGC